MQKLTRDDSNVGIENVQLSYLLDGSEFAAMAELGYGSPIVAPEFGSPEAGRGSLLARGLADAAGELAPAFGAMWRVAVLPQILGEVTRFSPDRLSVWIYYVSFDAYVEEYVSNGQALLLGSKLETLPLRLALNTGLLVDSARAVDPLASRAGTGGTPVGDLGLSLPDVEEEPSFGLKFTNVRSNRELSMSASRVGPSVWEVDGRRVNPVELLEMIATGISDLFDPE